MHKFVRRPDLEGLFSSVSNSRMVYSLIADIKNPMIKCETICLFYKPPPFSIHLFCELFDELSQVGSFPKKCGFILGDLNCNLLKIGEDKESYDLFDILSSSGLLPTKFFSHVLTLLDIHLL